MDINPFWILVVLFVLTPESTLIIGSEIAPPSMNNPNFEPEVEETEMPPFDDSFIEEILSGGPLEGNKVLTNSGTSEVPKNVIAEYLKSIVDFFKF